MQQMMQQLQLEKIKGENLRVQAEILKMQSESKLLDKRVEQTGADAIMIGRAAQGRPWIFREIAHFLDTGEIAAAPPTLQVRDWLVEHLHDHYSLYGERAGVRRPKSSGGSSAPRSSCISAQRRPAHSRRA